MQKKKQKKKPKALFRLLSPFHDSSSFSDIVLKAENVCVQAHRLVLAAHSPSMAAMLQVRVYQISPSVCHTAWLSSPTMLLCLWCKILHCMTLCDIHYRFAIACSILLTGLLLPHLCALFGSASMYHPCIQLCALCNRYTLHTAIIRSCPTHDYAHSNLSPVWCTVTVCIVSSLECKRAMPQRSS